MGRIAEWLKKAEDLARGHSKQTDQILEKAEEYAKERTGHKYDEHITKGVDSVQRRYGGGEAERQAGEETGAQSERPQPPPQRQPEQPQEHERHTPPQS